MRRPLPRIALAAALAAASGCAASGTGAPPADPPGRAPPLPPPAPPGRPEAEEARLALAAGSSAALILYLARHPDAAPAPAIRAALAARRQPDDPAAVRALAAGEAEALLAFDAARRAGSAAAWDAFAARFPGHPLVAEAARWR